MRLETERARAREWTNHHKAVVLICVAAVAFGFGNVVAHLLSGSIAYWGIVAGPLWLSVRVAVPATIIAGVAGVASGFVLAKGRFPGRDLLETIGSLPIILPPTVIGFYLLQTLSPGTRTGGFLMRVVGHTLVYNVWGCIIAATIAAFPFCMRAARAAIEGVDPALERAARIMGMSDWRVALLVTVPLARRGIGAGLTIGCARALGEYGATLMVGGDIDGKTRTLSLAILDSFTTPERNTMLMILVLMAIVAMLGVGWLSRSQVPS
jgi:molybdate transport system permease protein